MEELVFKVVLLIHVFGAIAGFGPTFAFAILGPMAGRAGPNGYLHLEAIVAIEKRFVFPFIAIQPISGIILIFLGGFAQDFLRHYWLVAGILLFLIDAYLALGRQTPAIERMIEIAKAGPPTPEFRTLAQRTQRLGPIITVILSLIIILMVTKPGP